VREIQSSDFVRSGWRFELVAALIPNTPGYRSVRLSSENPSESRRTLTETCTVTFCETFTSFVCCNWEIASLHVLLFLLIA
jgi:hypothetical protein